VLLSGPLFPYTTLFRSPSIWPWIIGLLVLALLIWAIAEMVDTDETQVAGVEEVEPGQAVPPAAVPTPEAGAATIPAILSSPSAQDRKSTRLNSSHVKIS